MELFPLLVLALTPLMPGAVSPAISQPSSSPQESYVLEITVERKEETGWRAVEPSLVFLQGDLVRFRFRSDFDGYLYVMNLNTSGDYVLLFPREDTGQVNRFRAKMEYLIPATEGSFRIDGPPGHEVVYWLVSPLESSEQGSLSKSSPAPIRPPPKPGNPFKLIPRCDDTIFKARGDCVDVSAGPKEIAGASGVPENLVEVTGPLPRQLTFDRKEHSILISSPSLLKGPIVFEFRLSHR